MKQDTWSRVDDFFIDHFSLEDEILSMVLKNCEEKGLPPHNVSACQGMFLQILATACKAQRILEIGTLGGYSTIFLARAIGDHGQILTIESVPKHAEVATLNFKIAKLSERIKLLHGDARTKMEELVTNNTEAFDLVFIDADKPSNPIYLDLAIQLSKSGTIIIGDNVVRNGAVADESSHGPKVFGVRQFCEDLSNNHSLLSTGIQTVGAKGYDGFTVSIVK